MFKGYKRIQAEKKIMYEDKIHYPVRSYISTAEYNKDNKLHVLNINGRTVLIEELKEGKRKVISVNKAEHEVLKSLDTHDKMSGEIKKFSFLSGYHRILVTGPQRSGTMITSNMIGNDLKCDIVVEAKIEEVFEKREKQTVFQAPMLSSICHKLPEDIAVIFIMRDLQDIYASERRINWKLSDKERESYFVNEGTSAEVKQRIWREFQRDKISYSYEIEYESLKDHPMWVQKKNRRNFASHQIK